MIKTETIFLMYSAEIIGGNWPLKNKIEFLQVYIYGANQG